MLCRLGVGDGRKDWKRRGSAIAAWPIPPCLLALFLFTTVWIAGTVGGGHYRETMLHGGTGQDFLLCEVTAWVGMQLFLSWLIYTMVFTRFNFPARFRGGGRGQTVSPR